LVYEFCEIARREHDPAALDASADGHVANLARFYVGAQECAADTKALGRLIE